MDTSLHSAWRWLSGRYDDGFSGTLTACPLERPGQSSLPKRSLSARSLSTPSERLPSPGRSRQVTGIASCGMADNARPSSSPRNPNRWQDDQLAFRRAYAEDPGAFDRMPVDFRWWTRRRLISGGGIGALIGTVQIITRLIRGTMPGRLVALYRPDTPAGDPPFLCFEVFDETFGVPASGQGRGIIVGEPVPNGNLLLEVDDQVVLPRWNPTTEVRDAPGR